MRIHLVNQVLDAKEKYRTELLNPDEGTQKNYWFKLEQ